MLRLRQTNFARLISPIARLSSTAAPIPNSDNSASPKESRIQQIISADIRECNPVPVFKRALLHKKAALKDANGEFSYNDLVVGSKKLSAQISDICGAWIKIHFFSFDFAIIEVLSCAFQEAEPTPESHIFVPMTSHTF